MRAGRIVEETSTADLDLDYHDSEIILTGEVPDSARLPPAVLSYLHSA